ncbi:MAG: ComF family protein [Actinomycetota bacterium]
MTQYASSLVRDVLFGIRSLVFPSICVMCEELPGVICKKCDELWRSPATFTRFSLVPTSSVVAYSNQVSSVVLKAKEDRNRVARRLIAFNLYKSISLTTRQNPVQPLLLLPIPSSRQAIRRRGESFLHPILEEVIHIAQAHSLDWKWQEILIHRQRVRDQAGLSSRERSLNVQGAFAVRDQIYVDRPIIVVDDVITTGATLKNAILALNERKMTVLGAATACASAHQLLIR